jgi:hypothetical protein
MFCAPLFRRLGATGPRSVSDFKVGLVGWSW